MKQVAWGTLILLVPALACAVDFPSRTVTIVVAASPGGAADVQARLIAKGLSSRFGKPVVVDNRSGAGGRTAARLAAQATPDGHTLFVGSISILVIEPILRSNVGFDPQRDFAPISIISEMPLILAASPSLSAKTVADFIALARQQPGQLTYASWGPGTLAHLYGEMFKAATRIDLLHVPYKGAGPALIDVMAGHVSAMFVSSLAAMSIIRGGKLTALAVTGTRRLPALPEVPTIRETGIAGLDLPAWFGIFVPERTPQDIKARLSYELIAVLKAPEFTRSVEDQGGFVVASEAGEVSRRIQTDWAAIARLVKVTDLKVEE